MAKIRVEAEEVSSSASEAESFIQDHDEFDAEEMIMSDSSASEAESSAEQESQPAKKKQKKGFNPEALASAFQTVLRQKISSAPSESAEKDQVKPPAVPILSRRKAVERNIEEEELTEAARKILKAQIREAQDAMHISDANLPETLNYERSLRKLATRGVVHLFNTIRANQLAKEEEERSRRQAHLTKAYENLPLVGKDENPTDSYFEFLKQQKLRQ